jgi:hypothetical protein
MPVKCLDADVLSRIKQERSEAYLIKLIDMFLKEAPVRLQETWESGKAGNFKQTALASHILRCLAENLGALSIRDLAAAAESAASGPKETTHSVSRILFDLEIAFAETRACLLIARQGMAERP